jgi:hypothetical protein
MIVSTQFLQEVVHLINFDYFQNSYIRKVARWCTEHYDRYEVAPFDDITNIFRNKKIELQEDDADLVEKLLMNISTKYSFNTGINVPYQVDQTLLFFKKRELEITNSNIGILLDKNDIEGAEDQINNFAKISKITSGWIDPFETRYIDELFVKEPGLLKLPGDLGKFIGPLNAGWLVAVAAGFKLGKTFFMQELAVLAIQQQLRVAFFSLEMYRAASNERLYKRLTGYGTEEGGETIYPCLDCESNQDGSCTKPERTNKLPLMKGGAKPLFSNSLKYKPCTVCRKISPKDYRIAWWKEEIKRPAFNKRNITKHISALERIYNNNYRFKSYPRFSANTSDIIRDLDILERSEGFVPDVIVIDYADILKAEDSSVTSGVEQLDNTWKSLARLAGERRALVITASQITRAGMDKKQVKASDLASWIGKLAHIDVFASLQQTQDEKKDGVMRVGLLAHRYADFNENDNCVILQKLDHGQACLDSQMFNK